jgi:hypothetical protein
MAASFMMSDLGIEVKKSTSWISPIQGAYAMKLL